DTWLAHPFFARNASEIDCHPMRAKLGLPRTMAELVAEIGRIGKPLLENDEASRAWNGLLRDENFLLFRTRDPVTLAALISKGLLAVARKASGDKLQIELVNDSLTAADNLDAIAIATLDNVPLGGAGAAIDHVTSGTVSDARSLKRTLVSLKESSIDA